jgi:signal transduction histidine kinase/DNA-binding response OmpR family regulator
MLSSLKTKIALSMLVAVLLIAAAGVLAYNSLRKIKTAVETVSRPDLRLEKIQHVLDDVSEAESGIRAYSLSKDEKYLAAYYRLLSNAESNVDTLRRLSINHEYQQKDIYLLDSLISQKLDLFFKFLDLKNTAGIRVTLSDIAEKIPEPPPITNTITDTVSKAIAVPEHTFMNRIRSLFGRKKKETSVADTLLPAKLSPAKQSRTGNATREVKQWMARADQANKEQAAMLSQQELELLQRDAGIMEGIRSLIRKIEKEQRLLTSQNLSDARHTAEQASQTILFLFIFALGLLLMFTYFIFTDITRSNIYKQRLEESKKKTEELARIKENFLSNMSHEIRTPLNAIVGFTELLIKTTLAPVQEQYVGSVKRSSEHLLSVVNDILDFSKIEAGKLRIENTGYRLDELIDDITASMRQAAESKQITLQSSVQPAIKGQIFLGDPFRMKQVLLNLVSNAIKFTNQGQVEVKCSLSPSEDGKNMIRIDVTDTGIGIPANKIKTIFEEFSQADTSITRQYGGTGLGLAICKKLAGLLQGSITASSTPKKGSTFSFRVLCSKGTEKDLPAAKQVGVLDREKLFFENRYVLIADDDDMNRLLLKTILLGYRMKVDEAEDGQKAFQLASTRSYDIILTDIHMPELSGVNMVRQLRALSQKHLAEVPVIALTANIVKEDLLQYMEAGFTNYVLKPYSEQDLTEKMTAALHTSTPAKSEEYSDSLVSPPSRIYNLDELNRLTKGNKMLAYKMIESFAENTRANLAYMKDEATLGNWEHIGKIALKMGPSCLKFGLENVHALLQEIERNARNKNTNHFIPDLIARVEQMISPVLEQMTVKHQK